MVLFLSLYRLRSPRASHPPSDQSDVLAFVGRDPAPSRVLAPGLEQGPVPRWGRLPKGATRAFFPG